MRERRLLIDALMRMREAEMELLKERKKTLDRSFASVKKELAGVKEECVSPPWYRGGVSKMIGVSDKDVDEIVKSVA